MIRDFSPFPYIEQNGEVKSGLLFSPNHHCANCEIKECAKIAYEAKQVGGIGQCFKGVQYSYNIDPINEEIVWIGFLVKGTKYPKNFRDILKSGFEIDLSAFKIAIDRFGRTGILQSLANDLKSRGESQALHDLVPLINAMSRTVERGNVKAASDATVANISVAQIELLQKTTFEIFNILGAVKNQVQLSGFLMAPDATQMKEIREINLDGLFLKNIHIYNVLAEPYEKKIILVRDTNNSTRKLSELVQLLPSILLQNAVKYSRSGTEITVRISSVKGKIRISVTSIGAIVPKDRREYIWQKGARYINENDTSKSGSGFGLYLARMICAKSGLSVSYDCSNENDVDGVTVGENTFTLDEL